MTPIAPFPLSRPRRLRRTAWIRAWSPRPGSPPPT